MAEDPKSGDGAANSRPELTSEQKRELIERLLRDTKERWLRDSSQGILCCTEDRPGIQ